MNNRNRKRASKLRRQKSRNKTRNSRRRGILLLVVLSMLTLFLMIGSAFVVTSNQYRRANKTYAKVDQSAHMPAKQQLLVDEVLGQLLRDTNNQFSNLRYHSLLRDVYGNDGFLGQINGIANDGTADGCTWDSTGSGEIKNFTSGQILELKLNPNTAVTDYFGNSTPLKQLSSLHNAYNGLVVTFLDGEARGQSTRIVGYFEDTATSEKIFRVLSFNLANGQTVTDPSALNGSRILINGRPFNGTGVGFNFSPATTARLTAREAVGDPVTQRPIALMPSPVFLDATKIFESDYLTTREIENLRPAELTELLRKRGLPGLGGSDESYDAVDFQNMFLAMLPMNPQETAWSDLSDPRPLDLGSMVLPSFHRPALLNYWANTRANGVDLTDPENAQLLRKVLLRPNWFDHPEFTGSNPEFANLGQAAYQLKLNQMIFGPWDVDNDNDGVRDSVWVDFGAPVMEGPHGKLVKPLAAVLVLDMDGRLNLNAHGTMEMVRDPAKMPASQRLASPKPDPMAPPPVINWSEFLPRGEGYGPADINLGAIINDPGPDFDPHPTYDEIFRRLLGVGANTNYLGRYGYNTSPGPSEANQVDLLAQIKTQGLPQTAKGRLTADAFGIPLGEYATPPNLAARYAVGLNDLGQPVYDSYRVGNNGSLQLDTVPFDTTSPYQSNLSMDGSRGESTTSADGMFSVAELERLLRAYDPDAGAQPSRLWNIADGFVASNSVSASNVDLEELNEWRTLLTTDSYDMPVPNSILPEWVKDGVDGTAGNADDFEKVMGRPPVRGTFTDLLEYRVRVGLGFLDPLAYSLNTNNQQMRVRQEVFKLLPQDLADGLRLDINRPFGNGRDDNRNGVVDEPGEWEGDPEFDRRGRDQEAIYWRNDGSLPLPESFTSDTLDTGTFRDDLDRNRDGVIENWERGDSDDDNRISFEERVVLHNFRRQLLARDLYVLAMTVADPPPSGMSKKKRDQRARRLAQWAINIVDFRDSDNCMTPFEFDENPFNGWGVDGNVTGSEGPDNTAGTPDDDTANERYVVWGTERPELLITETLAWHDRRATDVDFESTNFKNNGETSRAEFTSWSGEQPSDVIPDLDYDQVYRPRGAAFIEIYNPYPSNPAVNADTHAIGRKWKPFNESESGNGKTNTDYDNDTRIDPPDQDLGVHIAAVDQQTGTTPVWRIAVYQRPDNANPGLDDDDNVSANPLGASRVITPADCADWDPDSPELKEQPDTLMDRCIYLAPMNNRNNLSASTLQEINSREGTGTQVIEYYSILPVPTVRPGRYLVIGSGEEQDGKGEKLVGSGIFASEIGDLDPFNLSGNLPGKNERRRIELDINNLETPIKYVEPDNTNKNVRLFGNERAYLDPEDRSRAICDVAVITHAVVNGKSYPRRFTFTEPAQGYPGDPGVVNTDPNRPDIAYYDNPNPTEESRYGNAATPAAYDRPHDDVRWDELFFRPDLQPGDNFYDDQRLQLPRNSKSQYGLIPCYCVVYLQRLANPLLPFHKDTNPYRTIDTMSTNVSLFNGAQGSPGEGHGEKFRNSPETPPVHYGNASNTLLSHFASLQRGYAQANILGLKQTNPPNRNEKSIPDRVKSSLDPNESLRFNVFGHEPPSVEPGKSNVTLAPFGVQTAPTGNYYNRHVPTGHTVNIIPDFTLGSLNHTFMSEMQREALFSRVQASDSAALRTYNGLKPEKPFSWLTWNNRPFISGSELMLVPTSRSSRLLQEFSTAENTNYPFIEKDPLKPAVIKKDPYDKDLVPGLPPENGPYALPKYWAQRKQGTFGHLPNFYLSDPPEANKLPDVVAGLSRVLDYIQVPSRFVGTETWLNPTFFGQKIDTSIDARMNRQPPFNKIRSYREPGRVNINTVVDRRVWEGGIMHRQLIDPVSDWNASTNYYDIESGHAGPTFDQTEFTASVGFLKGINQVEDAPLGNIVTSRRGYGNYNSSIDFDTLEKNAGMRLPLALDNNFPTFFANPFRSPDAGTLVPLEDMINKGAQCTMLRQDFASPQLSKPPLFAGATTNDIRTSPPYETANPIEENTFRDSNKNPYFLYQPMTRLANLTTTRSNVFAVWVTIGYFEVEEINKVDHEVILERYASSGKLVDARQNPLFNKVYPEGYMLGQESGSETGDIRRIREFAIIDRTIPVAFEPGKNHNVERAVRLRRRIE